MTSVGKTEENTSIKNVKNKISNHVGLLELNLSLSLSTLGIGIKIPKNVKL